MTHEAALVGHEPVARRTPRRRRRDIDWRAVELDYRAGRLSLRAMAERHGCSHSAIANFAGRHGWTRTPVQLPAGQ